MDPSPFCFQVVLSWLWLLLFSSGCSWCFSQWFSVLSSLWLLSFSSVALGPHFGAARIPFVNDSMFSPSCGSYCCLQGLLVLQSVALGPSFSVALCPLFCVARPFEVKAGYRRLRCVSTGPILVGSESFPQWLWGPLLSSSRTSPQ